MTICYKMVAMKTTKAGTPFYQTSQFTYRDWRLFDDCLCQKLLIWCQCHVFVNIIMAALWNRASHYTCIFMLWFVSFFSSPTLSSRRLDVYHTSTHGVALVQI